MVVKGVERVSYLGVDFVHFGVCDCYVRCGLWESYLSYVLDVCC